MRSSETTKRITDVARYRSITSYLTKCLKSNRTTFSSNFSIEFTPLSSFTVGSPRYTWTVPRSKRLREACRGSFLVGRRSLRDSENVGFRGQRTRTKRALWLGSGITSRYQSTSANSGVISVLGQFSKARQRRRLFDRKANARISRVYRVRIRAITKLPIDIVQIRFIFFGRRFEKGRYLRSRLSLISASRLRGGYES